MLKVLQQNNNLVGDQGTQFFWLDFSSSMCSPRIIQAPRVHCLRECPIKQTRAAFRTSSKETSRDWLDHAEN